MQVGRGVTVATVVREDLAQIHEVADLLRAIGPTLVLTILLDGPQLASRWTARYASVHADAQGILLTAAFELSDALHVLAHIVRTVANQDEGLTLDDVLTAVQNPSLEVAPTTRVAATWMRPSLESHRAQPPTATCPRQAPLAGRTSKAARESSPAKRVLATA